MNAFLESEHPPAAPAAAAFHVIPASMETSVSYGGGARLGPRAIIEASQQLEADIYGLRPGDLGIHTQKPVAPKSKSPAAWLDAIETRVAEALRHKAVPVLLGGEHTVTLGAARALRAAGRKVGFLHFDAHADLRDTYEGSPLSHACVMRRVHELGFPILQIATRAVSAEERDYRRAHRKTLTAYDAIDIAQGDMPPDFIPRGFPKELYVTFDVDALDPAAMPATGTPVPGGLFWYDVVRILRKVVAARRIVGIDMVELAPVKGLHHADFTAALLTQLLMALALH
ncbi:MAG: agmatinase [Kiritimatiellaeota bacterium]|nr:agmatinase [Kiritimatiellota bacterium]